MDRHSGNDIKYRGPLSYRHLRMFAWLFLIISQVGVILKLATKVNPANNYGWLMDNISKLSSLVIPLFLIANFSEIFTSQKNYKSVLLRYAILSSGTALLFFYFYEHIIGGLYDEFVASDGITFNTYASFLHKEGYLAFNVFLDLLLCSLFMFFLDFTPNKVFTGKKIIIFRLFAILPVVYELTSIILRIRASMMDVFLSPYMYPFLTTKPPLCFLAFLILGILLFVRKNKYLKIGKTEEEYREYLKTNANSLHFSIWMAIVFAVVAILDLILVDYLPLIIVAAKGLPRDLSPYYTMSILNCGIGDSIVLLILAPLTLLYSYNKKHSKESAMVDNALPLLGIVLIILVYAEGLYRIALMISRMYATEIEFLKSLPDIIRSMPEIVQDLPEILESIPEIMESLPQALSTLPQSIEGIPELMDKLPIILESISEIEQELPAVVDSLPKIMDSIPEIIQSLPAELQRLLEFLRQLPEMLERLPEMLLGIVSSIGLM